MHLQFDLLRISSRLYLIYVLLIFSINSGESHQSKYILPSLPDTPYTLNDVIILPENADAVETTIITLPSSTVLATVNLTKEGGFRLGFGDAFQNVSVKSGLQIITTSKTTLVLELATGLVIPSTEDYGHIYHIFALKDDLGESQDKHLLIQSSVSGTSIKLCALSSEEDEKIYNFARYSRENPMTTDCTRMKVPVIGGLLLNNRSMWPEMEITSEHPISILEGHTNYSSSFVKNESYLNFLKVPLPPISWNVIPPVTNRSNQFVLIPSKDRRDVKLWIMSPVNTSVYLRTGAAFIRHNLTEKKPSNISVSIVPGDTLIITGKDTLSLSCIKVDTTSCDKDIFPYKADLDHNSILKYDNKLDEYQWIYISKDTTVLVICPLNLDISVYSLNNSIETAEEINLNTNDQFLKMTYFPHARSGLYNISFNASLEMCSIVYLQKDRLREFDNDQNLSESTMETEIPSLLSQVFNKYASDSPVLTRNITSYFFTSTSSSRGESAEGANLLTETISIDRNMSDVKLAEDKMQNTSASHLSRKNVVNNRTSSGTSTLTNTNDTEYSAKYKSKTQNTIKLPNNMDNDSQHVNEVIGNVDSNNRFKAVVDILHSKDGSENVIITKSNKRSNPPYTYRSNINGDSGQSDGKSLVAIIASLVSAILAVGAIILIYLLKELFSRRQKIRKTRIRPFVSYY